MPHLPNEFILYIPTRAHMNSLVRVTSSPGTEPYVSVLSYPPLDPTDSSYKVKFDKAKPESSPYGTYGVLHLPGLSAAVGSAFYKKIFEMKDIHVTSETNEQIPVLRFTEPSKFIHGTTHLHRNFAISKFEVPPAVAAPAPVTVHTTIAPPAPAAAIGSPSVSPIPVYNAPTHQIYDASFNIIAPYNMVNGPAPSLVDGSGNAITHVSNSVISNALNAKKKKVKPPTTAAVAALPPAKPKGDLSAFVAKQLMDLAKSRGEFCPIVAEEFSAGNTAVMPCGHLFAQIAIEESFKKEPHKCPACRQTGRPTYV